MINPRSQLARRPRFLVGAAAGSAMVLAVLALLLRQTPAAPSALATNPVATVKAFTVRAGTLSLQENLTGQAVPANTLTLSSPVAGTIASLPLKLGQSVSSGQVLATITDPSLTANLASAQANLAAAESKLGAVLGPLPAAQMASNQAALASAESAVTTAQNALSLLNSPDSTVSVAVRNAQQALTFEESSSSPVAVAVSNAQNALAAATGSAAVAAQEELNLAVANRTQAIQQAEATLSAATAAKTAAVATAQANLSAAQTALNKTSAAETAAATASPSSVAALQSAVTAAQAGVTAAQAAIAATTLRSPFAGIVTSLSASSGELAAPGTPLLTLVSHQLTIAATVTQAQALAAQGGQRVAWDIGSHPLPVTNPVIVPQSGKTAPLYTLIASIPSSLQLLPNQIVSGTITTQSASGLLVPASALLMGSNGHATIDVIRRGRVYPTGVRVSLSTPNRAVIGGLAAGARVVQVANPSFTAGQPVRNSGAGA
ncbi:MAG: biotin/lipoyl-binding protein [Thermaerobacter sp.]|nr:biotin/lipoyl-binding protein [Thermaerobacter sp.]